MAPRHTGPVPGRGIGDVPKPGGRTAPPGTPSRAITTSRGNRPPGGTRGRERLSNETEQLSDFDALHAIRVGGLHAETPADAGELAARGLIFVTPVGCMLTDEGTQLHTTLLEQHRAGVDLATVRTLYDRFLAVNQPAKSKCTEWQRLEDDEDARFVIAGDLQDILDRVSTTITRTAAILPRFGEYPPRLRSALDKVFEGQSEFLTGARVPSFHNVWMACHEDYLLTLGISREEEGSY
jgi:hypothetical protein